MTTKTSLLEQFKGIKPWTSKRAALAHIVRDEKEILVWASALRDWIAVVGVDFDVELGRAETLSWGMSPLVLTLKSGGNTAHFYPQSKTEWYTPIIEVRLT